VTAGSVSHGRQRVDTRTAFDYQDARQHPSWSTNRVTVDVAAHVDPATSTRRSAVSAPERFAALMT